MPRQRLLALVFPEGLLLLASVALVHWDALGPATGPVARFYTAAVLVAGSLLVWRFRRGRLAAALTGLVLADRALVWLAPFDSGAAHAGPVVVRTVAMLVPASLAVLAFVDERGLFTAAGLRRLAVLGGLAGVVLVVWIISSASPEAAASAFDFALVPRDALSWLPIGQPAGFVALAAIVTLAGRTAWKPDAETRGFLWAAIGSVIATSASPEAGRATLYFTSAGLVLVVAAVESAYAMAYHDELTGLPARRALNDALARLGDTYTVAIVDVDHFKKFNDTHGHDVGDQVLRMVASRLGRVGGGGRAFRYGGEEFAVLFPGKSIDESESHLEQLRATVASAKFALRGRGRPRRKPKSPRARKADVVSLGVTVSIGAAQARRSLVPAEVVKAADKALYRAKAGGRNRVET